MGKTKFVVLSLKDLLKKGALIVVAIAVVVFIMLSVTPKAEKEEELSYVPGEYKKEIVLENIAPFYVTVVISEDKISDLYISDLAENHRLFYPLIETTFETVKNQVLKTQSTSISVSPDVLETSKVLLSAVEDALYDSAMANSEIE